MFFSPHSNPSSQTNTTLLLYALTFKHLLRTSTKCPTIIRSSFDSPHKTKSSAYKRPRDFHSLPSHPPHLHFHLFHHCIYIRIKNQIDMMQPRLNPLSILEHSFSPPFTLTQARLLTYIFRIKESKYRIHSCEDLI